MDISMKKSPMNSNISFTAFQELVFFHSRGLESTRYPKLIDCGEPKWSSQEIIDNEELETFRLFRLYKNSDENVPSEPKTPVLAYLYLIDQFIGCHCQTIAQSIASKCNSETFLDEYNARWQSYVSLIEIFETEYGFLTNIMNQLSDPENEDNLFEEEKESPPVSFSLLRFMARSWGKNVMKSLFSMFQDKITSILESYQKILIELAENFDSEASKKGFQSRIKHQYKLDPLIRDILRQALLCILDMSVNESNIKMLNNSLLPLETFYLKIEEMLINNTKEFMKRLFEDYPIRTFMVVSEHYCENVCEATIKRTQRRLNSYVTECIKRTLEHKITKNYMKFVMNHSTPTSGMKKCDSIPEVDSSNSDEEEKNVPCLKMSYKRSSTKKYNPVEDYEELTPEEKKICNKLTYVVRLAKGNKKKVKALEESKL